MNVKLVGCTVPSLGSLELSPQVTSAVGCDASTTVNVAVPPLSVVGPVVGLTMTPAMSSSTLITNTSPGIDAA